MELRIEREGTGVALRLPANEQALVRSLAADLVETLGEAPADPSLRRLTPPAYDDEADERGYREIMGAELLNGRVQALELLAATAGHERLSGEEAEAWLRALNDLRLPPAWRCTRTSPGCRSSWSRRFRRTRRSRPLARLRGEDRGEVGFEKGTVVVVHARRRGARAVQPIAGRYLVARKRVRAGKRLVGEGEIEVVERVRRGFRQLQAATCVVEGRLGAFEHRVGARALPLAPDAVDELTSLQPVVRRRVCAVEQLVVLFGVSVSGLHQRPGLVEEVDAQPSVLVRGEGVGTGLHDGRRASF
ncbi:MAG: DUF2017 family protein [Actinobacteria bacterium]|nr:MAG: DUF2017 family protein [Actinomycetota bacterium]